jgi:hypothetical protein
VAEVQLKTGEIAVVDDADLPKVAHIKWYRHKQGYAVGYVPSSFRGAKDWHLVLMHQLILPGCPKVDHWDGDRLNNRRKNLRTADNFQHARNVSVRTTPGKTSKYKGVCWHKQLQRWWARIAGKSLGTFESEIEAAQAYNNAATRDFGEFAKLNIIR